MDTPKKAPVLVLAINPQTGTTIRVDTKAEAIEYMDLGWKLMALRSAPVPTKAVQS